MNCITYSRFNIIDLKNIINSNNSKYILKKLNIEKYIDKKENVLSYNYDEIMQIFNKIHIFQQFIYYYKNLNKENLNVYFISDNLPTIDDINKKNYNIVYLDNNLSLIYSDDSRIKDFEIFLEKIVYFKDILGTNFFYKNDIYKYNNCSLYDSNKLPNLIKQYVSNYKINDGEYLFCKISIENTNKIFYIKYRTILEYIQKIVLYCIDDYPHLFLKGITLETELYNHLYYKSINKPFIIEDINII